MKVVWESLEQDPNLIARTLSHVAGLKGGDQAVCTLLFGSFVCCTEQSGLSCMYDMRAVRYEPREGDKGRSG